MSYGSEVNEHCVSYRSDVNAPCVSYGSEVNIVGATDLKRTLCELGSELNEHRVG